MVTSRATNSRALGPSSRRSTSFSFLNLSLSSFNAFRCAIHSSRDMRIAAPLAEIGFDTIPGTPHPYFTSSSIAGCSCKPALYVLLSNEPFDDVFAYVKPAERVTSTARFNTSDSFCDMKSYPAALPTSGAIIVRTYGNTSTELELRIEIDRESIFAFSIHSFVISLFLCNSLSAVLIFGNSMESMVLQPLARWCTEAI